MNRQETIQHYTANPQVDVLIIGAGINGIGTFRDLALQGVSVLLVDKSDFCAGASAGSSHMLHGGIRYLENGEFRLVREALHERNLLLINAAHYAKPLPTTIPIFKWFSGFLNAPLKFLGLLDRPGERGGIIIKLGLMMYDWFTGSQQTMPYHVVNLRKTSLQKRPKLNPDIVCTATYYDAYMVSPERICVDLLRDALNASPDALALNYCRVVAGDKSTVTLHDDQTDMTFSVQPKVVINAAGPWIDFVNKALGSETKFIGGTKGSHLMLDNPELYEATGGSEIFFESEDGRIVLIFPYQGKVMMGTTDIRVENPEEVVCTPEETDYILNSAKRVFPDIRIDASQIVFTFCGVRPLPATADKRTGAISRDHSIQSIAPNTAFDFAVHSLVGGKWTTFRAFSEQASDVALKDLGKARRVDTAGVAIGGGKDLPKDDLQRSAWLEKLQRETELDLTHLAMLLDRYGTYAAEVAKYISQGNDSALDSLPYYTKREIQFLVKQEWIQHIDDFLLRRSSVAILGANKKAVVEEVGGIIGDVLGWSSEQLQQEIDRSVSVLKTKHGVQN